MGKFRMSDIDILITLFLLCPKHSEADASGKESKTMSPLIQHSGLNTIFRGCRHPISSSNNEVWQFRGIKYASIPSRFKQSILNGRFEGETDATRFGPKPPQPTLPVRLENALIGISPETASHPPDIFDEFNCLNLNITTPTGAKTGDNLPVLVYVYGGGGFSGSNVDWWCDGGSIVKRSVEIGKPVIMVAINYRLSVFGYIGSSEFLEANGTDNAANFGPRDVHTALTWLSHNITPFGGSPTSMTLYGESHGSIVVNALLHAHPPPPISRAIIQSGTLGTPIMTPHITLSEATILSNATKASLNIRTLAELEAVPWQDLLAAYTKSDPRNGMGHVPIVDGTFLREDWRDSFTFQGALLLGTTGNESAVLRCLSNNFPTVPIKAPTSTLLTSLHSLFSNSQLSAILETYNITPTTPWEDTAKAILDIFEDVVWYHAVDELAVRARQHGINVHEYSFEQGQPFGGPFKGLPAHAVDLAYLHGDPSIFTSTANPARELAAQHSMQDSWIKFAHGEGWNVDGGEAGVKVFGPEGETKILERGTFFGELRRKESWRVIVETFDDGERTMFLGTLIGHLIGLLGSGPSSG